MNRKALLGDPPPIRITPRDLGLLDALLAHLSQPAAVIEYLQREVNRAAVTDSAGNGPADAQFAAQSTFVRLGTRVTFADDQGTRHTATLVPPNEASRRPDGISILTPVGAALLGLSEGQSITYGTLDGRTKTVRIEAIHDTAA